MTETIKNYDLVIIGAGPAGLTASIYASRYRMANIVLGKKFGGQMTMAHLIGNYPGFESISGEELGQKFVDHARALGASVLPEDVAKIVKTGESFELMTSSGQAYLAKAIILSAGTERRRLNIPGEAEFLGRGVSYCSACDAPLFKEKTVAVIGGADAAVEGAAHSAQYAKKVYLIYRRGQLRAEPIWIEKLRNEKNVEVIYNTNVLEISGDQTVKQVKLDKAYQDKETLDLEGVIIEIGSIPIRSLTQMLGVTTDESGYIQIGEHCETNVEGVFAAGDITSGTAKLQQIVTACAEGAIAANSVFKHLKGQAAPVQWG